MLMPTWDVRCKWSATSLLGSWGTAFTGANENLSSLVTTISWSRGRDDLLTSFNAGEATITLNDPNGVYNPQNASSPIASNLMPFKPIYIKATYGATTYPLFWGFVRDITFQPGHRWNTAQIRCLDLTTVLDGGYPVIASTGSTTTGGAIGTIHDALGTTNPSMRSFSTGDIIPDFSADGSQSALQDLTDLLTAELGTWFVNGSGVSTYLDRHARATHTSPDATFTGNVLSTSAGTTMDTIGNRATVTRTGGVTQTYSDATSVNTYGYRDISALDTPYLVDDLSAQGLAQWLVMSQKDPRSPLWGLNVRANNATTLTTMLGLELGQRIRVSAVGSITTQDYNLEAIKATANTDSVDYSLVMSERTAYDQPFTLDVSKFDSADPIAY